MIVLLASSENIDIAVDLCCYTARHRTNIFAMSAAPVQVHHLWAGTMGTDYFDYIIADKTIIPETHKKYYSENETKQFLGFEIVSSQSDAI